MDADDWVTGNRRSYDTLAAEYARTFGGYLATDPLDRAALRLFAELVVDGGGGTVLDVGCGPGHVTAFLDELLRGRGAIAAGVDVSPAMVRVARAAHPRLRFGVGDMTRRAAADASLGGVLLWYSLIHVPDAAARAVLDRAARALRPGGVLLVGFQAGDEPRHVTSRAGHAVDLRSRRRPVDRVAAWVREAGLVVDLQTVREPDGDPPHGRVLARRPG
jgi:SAM-dependent methyltransferase